MGRAKEGGAKSEGSSETVVGGGRRGRSGRGGEGEEGTVDGTDGTRAVYIDQIRLG